MNRLSGFLVGVIALMTVTSPAHAELSLQQDRLTLHVQAVPLAEVLVDLSREGGFRLTILDKSMTNTVTVTEHFDEVPLEDGLSRLLAHWNYGLTTRSDSNQIYEVFLASKRPNPEDLPAPTPATPVRGYEDASRHRHASPEAMASFASEEDYSEEGADTGLEDVDEHEFSADREPFTEEMIPDDLPPDVRDAMLRDLGQRPDHR